MAESADDHYNVLEAQTHFSRLLAQVEAGREITMARNGRPIARVVPIRTLRPVDAFGCMAGRLPPLPDDVDTPDPEIERLFGMR